MDGWTTIEAGGWILAETARENLRDGLLSRYPANLYPGLTRIVEQAVHRATAPHEAHAVVEASVWNQPEGGTNA